ncbi:alanine racemase [Alkalibacter saccharofermentans]|uniref:Alanine racemase n=1 Tax=Alkalibacter saccharofermentans DSM 14828 TaxID=1120975 RepID=A0A1M4TGG9_9FIRM|nr:alanine racemase [Alkalibacter saccharofermentans]SHE43434.1 alanine racemase [Alkalibacter saccharofermentans DSM 14828]
MEYRPTWCEINLDNLIENYNNIQKHVGESVAVMPVVKADSYGHGAVECARALCENGAKMLGVAFDDEGIQLRKSGIDVPILIMGYTPIDHLAKILKWGLIPTVYQVDFAKKLSIRAEKKVKIHIKLDTGMGRLGFRQEESVSSIMEISQMKNIEIEGIFSHFAVSDEKDKRYSYSQMKIFDETVTELEKRGLRIPLKHMANSGGIIDLKDSHYDMVRPGITLYGMYPSDEVDCEAMTVKPVKEFYTRISHIKHINAGDSVSYGRRYVADSGRLIATLPVGYADGYSRLLTNKAQVKIGEHRYPIIGTVCMDQIIIDITGSKGIKVGDKVLLYGKGLPIEEIATHMGTINYEISCMTKERVPKVYIKNGLPFKVISTIVEQE